jgi:hypothetical protein
VLAAAIPGNMPVGIPIGAPFGGPLGGPVGGPFGEDFSSSLSAAPGVESPFLAMSLIMASWVLIKYRLALAEPFT